MSLVDVKDLVIKNDNYVSIVTKLETLMRSLYKTHKGEIQLETYEAYPYEIVGDMFEVVKENFKAAIISYVQEGGKVEAEQAKILNLAFHLSYQETSRVSKTFFDFIQSRIYFVLAHNGLLEKVKYADTIKENEIAQWLATGEEDDVYKISSHYNSYEKIVKFFESEVPYLLKGEETTKPVAILIADLIAQMNNVAIASMKSRIRQTAFQQRLDRLNDFNMRSSLIEALHVYQQFKEEEKKKAA
ncbi:hypothetical protein [Pseudomonas extremaustralis]